LGKREGKREERKTTIGEKKNHRACQPPVQFLPRRTLEQTKEKKSKYLETNFQKGQMKEKGEAIISKKTAPNP